MCGNQILVVAGGFGGDNAVEDNGMSGCLPSGFELAYGGASGSGPAAGAAYPAPFTLKGNFIAGNGGAGTTTHLTGYAGQSGGICILCSLFVRISS